MNKLIMIFILLVCASSVFGMASYCGDGFCTVDTGFGYDEASVSSRYYCPLDCGDRVNRSYCEDTYDLRSGDCPTCTTYSTPTCTVDSVPKVDLDNYCHGTGTGGSSNAGSSLSNYYWLIFLIIGLMIGFYYGKKKKGRK